MREREIGERQINSLNKCLKFLVFPILCRHEWEELKSILSFRLKQVCTGTQTPSSSVCYHFIGKFNSRPLTFPVNTKKMHCPDLTLLFEYKGFGRVPRVAG